MSAADESTECFYFPGVGIDAVANFDEASLRHCMGALLPSFRWETGDPAQTAEVVPLHGEQSA